MQKMKTYYGDSFLFYNNFEQGWHMPIWKGEISPGLNVDKQLQGFLKQNNPLSVFKMKHKVIIVFCFLPNKKRGCMIHSSCIPPSERPVHLRYSKHTLPMTTCSTIILQQWCRGEKRGESQGIPSTLPNKWKLVPTMLKSEYILETFMIMYLCVPRLHLGTPTHRTSLVQVIYLMEELREAILKSSCNVTWLLDIQESCVSPTFYLYSMQIRTTQKY